MNLLIDKIEEEFMEQLADTSMFVESLGGESAMAEDMIEKLRTKFNRLIYIYENTEGR